MQGKQYILLPPCLGRTSPHPAAQDPTPKHHADGGNPPPATATPPGCCGASAARLSVSTRSRSRPANFFAWQSAAAGQGRWTFFT